MTTPRQVLLNTLEQVLSTDFNRVGALAGKAAMDALIFAEASFVHVTPRSVVLDGLDATVGAGLTVDISDGSLARFDAAAGADASKYELGTLQALQNIVFDGANAPDSTDPRIHLIHGTPASNDTDSSSRNVLVLPGRTVVSTSVSKTREPALTLGIEPGAATPSPVFPTAPAGTVALWYVLLPPSVVTIDPDHLIDARVQFNPAALSRAHHRVSGLYVSPDLSTLTGVDVESGRALVNGAALEVLQNGTFATPGVFGSGVGSLASSTEYTLYAVVRGNGDLVSKNVTDGFIPVLALGLSPDPDGRPSSPIAYRPISGPGVTPFDAVTRTTSNALYLGTLHTTGSAIFQLGGDGIPTNKDGTQSIQITGRSFAARAVGFIQKPRLVFLSTTTVNLTDAHFVIEGVEGASPLTSATMPGDLVSGDAETFDTFYFVYLRPRFTKPARGAIRDYVLKISTEAPNTTLGKPTPEAGFNPQDYLYVGSFFNDASSDILKFQRDGNNVFFTSAGGAPKVTPPGGGQGPTLTPFDVAEDPAATELGSFVPKSSRTALVLLRFFVTLGGPDFLIFHETGNTIAAGNEHYRIDTNTGLDPGFGQTAFPILVDAGEKFEVAKTAVAAVGVTYIQQGYVEDIEAPAGR